MKQKVATIIGSNGQDGQLIASLLKKRNYKIIKISKENFDITSRSSVENFIKTKKPNEIYFLAAYHHSSENRININVELNYKINYFSLIYFLEAIKNFSTKSRLFFASSSFIFKPSKNKQTEKTLFQPNCHYSMAKVFSMKLCNFYRQNYKIFVSCGILYNHESLLRDNHFLSKKIILHAINNFKNSKKKLILNNVNYKIDWGYALDYVDAMIRILNHKIPDDFIVSTGKLHSVRDFVVEVYNYLNLDYRDFVVTKDNSKIINFRLGDPSKLKKACDWRPSITFKEMIVRLVQKQLESF